MEPLSLTTGMVKHISFLTYLENCIAKLSAFFFRFDQALDLLVPVSFIHCCTSTSGLSTMWSSWGLTPFGWEILS